MATTRDEDHDMAVATDVSGVVRVECSCGWQMDRPGSWPDRYAPWSVRELVNVSNTHLAATA